jgi:hypothetical protein
VTALFERNEPLSLILSSPMSGSRDHEFAVATFQTRPRVGGSAPVLQNVEFRAILSK